MYLLIAWLFLKNTAVCIADRGNARLVCINAGLADGSYFGTLFGRSSGHKVSQLKIYWITLFCSTRLLKVLLNDLGAVLEAYQFELRAEVKAASTGRS